MLQHNIMRIILFGLKIFMANKLKLALFLFAVASAAQALNLDTVVISSEDESLQEDMAQRAIILDRQQIEKNSGSNLGELLDGKPGVSNAAFGPGVGRPVLRGMHGSRVKIMANGIDSHDVSAMSSDHAPMADLAAATQLEVIHGPSTLLYGGGAIGGVVNIIDNKIHRQGFTGSELIIGSSYSSNNQGQQLVANANAGNGKFALHVDGFHRLANDYRSGKYRAKSYRVLNSDTYGKGQSLGLSYNFKPNSHLGFSASNLNYNYGVPNAKNQQARIDPQQTRYQLSAKYAFEQGFITAISSKLAYSDYQHSEYTAPVVEGLFKKQKLETTTIFHHRLFANLKGSLGIYYAEQDLKLCHDHSGCNGIPHHDLTNWNGNSGALLNYRNGYIFAHDTPMPITNSYELGYFLVEKADFERLHLSVGARVDFKRIDSDASSVGKNYRRQRDYYATFNFAPVTLAAAVVYDINQLHSLGINLARAQRAPDAEELYWNGDHHATFSYQLDNINLENETAFTTDISWRINRPQQQFNLSWYHYQFDDFIYNDRKSIRDPYHGNPVYRYEQEDAVFSGFDVAFEQIINSQLSFYAQADYVVAKLKNSSNKYLPRTPPASFLLKLKWQQQNWQAELENQHKLAQKKLANNESASKKFNSLNTSFSYQSNLGKQEYKLGLAINNILDESGQNHVSYLKQFAPEMGRNIKLNFSIEF